IDDHRNAEPAYPVRQGIVLREVGEYLDMPVAALEALRHGVKLRQWNTAAAHEITEANATYPAGGEIGKRGIIHILRTEDGHAAEMRAEPREGREGCSIIRSIDGRLHDDATIATESSKQGAIFRSEPFGRRIATLLAEGKAIKRPEDVGVAIA